MAPILGYPWLCEKFIVTTDTSGVVIGDVLSQVQGGLEQVVAYYSKTLSRAKNSYFVTQQELLAFIL
jgi:hypothetical protein